MNREQTWNKEDGPFPNPLAADWNCKFRISSDKTNTALASSTTDGVTTGFLRVQIESYGFDEVVTVMSQPSGDTKIKDWISNRDANGVRVH